jgi:hypothetical protein
MSTSKKTKAITISIKGENSQKKLSDLSNLIAGVHPNGGRYTYSSQEFVELAHEAEQRCAELELNKATRIGVKLVAVSGDPVAKAYGYGRLATRVELIRVASGWRVVSITSTTVKFWGGHVTLMLTPGQIKHATDQLMKRVGAERL